MEFVSDRVFRFLGLLVNVELAVAAVLLATWWTVVAFVGGTMPVLGLQTEGGIGLGLLWLFVADPLTFGVFRAAAWVISACLDLLAAPIGKLESRRLGRPGEDPIELADDERTLPVLDALQQSPALNAAQLAMATGEAADELGPKLDELVAKGVLELDGGGCYRLARGVAAQLTR